MTRRTLYPWWTWTLWVLLVPLGLTALGFAAVAATDVHTLLFDNPHLWWLCGAAPVAGLLVLYGVARRRRALQRFCGIDEVCGTDWQASLLVASQLAGPVGLPDPAPLAPLLAASVSPSRQAIRSALIVVGILMIAAAIIGPRWGIYLEKQKRYGIDIVVALDVSRSMLARDVQPNRLERAKREIHQQLTERAVFQHANRLALLAFAGSTSLRLPLTTDHLAFRSKLEQLTVGSAPRGGTAIAEAIRASTNLFARSPKEATKIILLFTDGEDHQGGPVEAARAAFEEHGIRTFTIGVGDPSRTVGVQVPMGEDTNKPLLHDGQIVFSKLDVAALQQIGEAGGGRFASITDLHALVDAIAGMHKTQLSTEERIRHKPRYQWFVATAILLLFLEMLMSERRSGGTDFEPARTWELERAP
jgi:Ca-activated chloride channel family protein